MAFGCVLWGGCVGDEPSTQSTPTSDDDSQDGSSAEDVEPTDASTQETDTRADSNALDGAETTGRVEDTEVPVDTAALEDPGAETGAPAEEATVDLGVEESPVTFVGAGDIAKCSVLGLLGLVRDPCHETADLVLSYPPDTPVFTLGDNAYADGSVFEFASCYEPSWGQFKDRTHPTAGNHDYNTDDAEPYFDYFGSRAGDEDEGYYSYDLGEWHIVVLNSNCTDLPPGFCETDSAQLQWLRADLAAHPRQCTMAMWHHPRWASDRAGANTSVEPFYQALYDADADLVLVGHAHNYERFAPLTPQGERDLERGIRQFVVGTGGADLRPLVELQTHSEVFESEFGILELQLYSDRYTWRFVPTAGSFTDSGEQRCH